jgi:hypothetical protein
MPSVSFNLNYCTIFHLVEEGGVGSELMDDSHRARVHGQAARLESWFDGEQEYFRDVRK